MNDTHPEVNARFQNLMKLKSNEERLLMGCSMYDTAREIVESAIYAELQESGAEEIKKEVFLRFYGQEFDKAERERILSAL